MKKKIYVTIFGVIIIIGGLYLYLAYAHIYNQIKAVDLRPTGKQQSYIVNNNSLATKSLVYAALGDSLTSGVGVEKYEDSYPYLLAQSLAGTNTTLTLKSLSQPGATVGYLADNLLPTAISAQPDIVTILIGVNDIHNRISAAEFESEYDYILQELIGKTNAKIYVISIPMIGSGSLILPPYNYYYNYRTREFNDIIANLARVYNLKFIDLYTPTVTASKNDGRYYAADLFHPSAFGYGLWAQIIYDGINQ